MSHVAELFDLDIRLSVNPDVQPIIGDVPGGGLWPQAAATDDNTCGCLTHGCNTSETCDQQLEECGGIFTFPGRYCEDQSDGCGDGPGGTADCGDDPDHDDDD